MSKRNRPSTSKGAVPAEALEADPRTRKQHSVAFDRLEAFLHSIYSINPVSAGGRNNAGERVGVDPMRCVSHDSKPRLLTDNTIAAFCGVSRTQVFQWRKKGALTVYAADKAAISAGTHPALIWGDDFYVGAKEPA